MAVYNMAKANQKFIHPMKMFNVCRPATKQSVKLVERIRKKRKRLERKRINRQKFKAPRGFKLAKNKRYKDKTSDQIQNGFDVAKRLME